MYEYNVAYSYIKIAIYANHST